MDEIQGLLILKSYYLDIVVLGSLHVRIRFVAEVRGWMGDLEKWE